MQAFRSQLGDLWGDFYFKVFGTMGYKTWDGQIKSETYAQWNKLRNAGVTPTDNSNAPLSTPGTTPNEKTSRSSSVYFSLAFIVVYAALIAM